jgi:hypothetical protein
VEIQTVNWTDLTLSQLLWVRTLRATDGTVSTVLWQNPLAPAERQDLFVLVASLDLEELRPISRHIARILVSAQEPH